MMHPVDAEQVHGEHQGLEGEVVDAAAGVAQDLGVARDEAEHAERVDAGVHAGDDGDAASGDAVEALLGEAGGVPLLAPSRS